MSFDPSDSYEPAQDQSYDSEDQTDNQIQDDSQYSSQDDSQYSSQDDSQYSSQDDSQYSSQDDSQYSSQDDSQYSSQDDSQYSSQDDSQYSSQDDSQYSSSSISPEYKNQEHEYEPANNTLEREYYDGSTWQEPTSVEPMDTDIEYKSSLSPDIRFQDLTALLGSPTKARDFLEKYGHLETTADGVSYEDPRLGAVFFDNNSAQISPEWVKEMWQSLPHNIQSALQDPIPDYDFIIYGSAVEDGSRTGNLDLSKERAENLADFLKENYGVTADMTIVPLGESLANMGSEKLNGQALTSAWLEIIDNTLSDQLNSHYQAGPSVSEGGGYGHSGQESSLGTTIPTSGTQENDTKDTRFGDHVGTQIADFIDKSIIDKFEEKVKQLPQDSAAGVIGSKLIDSLTKDKIILAKGLVDILRIGKGLDEAGDALDDKSKDAIERYCGAVKGVLEDFLRVVTIAAPALGGLEKSAAAGLEKAVEGGIEKAVEGGIEKGAVEGAGSRPNVPSDSGIPPTGGGQTTRIESKGAVPEGQKWMKDPFTGQEGYVTASARQPSAVHGHIRGTGAEFETYDQALLRGEIGLQKPGYVAQGGPDFITARLGKDGRMEVIVSDATINANKSPRTEVGKWMDEVLDAISSRRLSLDNPQMEDAIRQAVMEGRVSVRNLTVKYTPRELIVKGW